MVEKSHGYTEIMDEPTAKLYRDAAEHAGGVTATLVAGPGEQYTHRGARRSYTGTVPEGHAQVRLQGKPSAVEGLHDQVGAMQNEAEQAASQSPQAEQVAQGEKPPVA